MYIVGIITSIGIAFGFLKLLLYLFPYTGLQGVISYPIFIVLGLIVGIVSVKIIMTEQSFVLKGLYLMSAVIVMFLIQIITYQQDEGPSIIAKTINSFRATNMYNSLDITKFSEYNREQQIVCSAKFNKESNEEYFTIWNSESKVKYHIISRKGVLQYDNQKISFDTLKSPNEITEIDSNGNRVVHTLKSIEYLFNIKSGASENWSIRKFKDVFVGYEKILNNANKREDNR